MITSVTIINRRNVVVVGGGGSDGGCNALLLLLFHFQGRMKRKKTNVVTNLMILRGILIKRRRRIMKSVSSDEQTFPPPPSPFPSPPPTLKTNTKIYSKLERCGEINIKKIKKTNEVKLTVVDKKLSKNEDKDKRVCRIFNNQMQQPPRNQPPPPRAKHVYIQCKTLFVGFFSYLKWNVECLWFSFCNILHAIETVRRCCGCCCFIIITFSFLSSFLIIIFMLLLFVCFVFLQEEFGEVFERWLGSSELSQLKQSRGISSQNGTPLPPLPPPPYGNDKIKNVACNGNNQGKRKSKEMKSIEIRDDYLNYYKSKSLPSKKNKNDGNGRKRPMMKDAYSFSSEKGKTNEEKEWSDGLMADFEKLIAMELSQLKMEAMKEEEERGEGGKREERGDENVKKGDEKILNG